MTEEPPSWKCTCVAIALSPSSCWLIKSHSPWFRKSREVFLILFYWCIVDLQRVNFCCIAKWIQFYIYIYVCIYIYAHFFIVFHYGLSQDIEYINSSLGYTVGPCCLSILHIVVCICWSQPPNPPLSHLTSRLVCSLCLWICFCFVDKFICVVFKIPHISDGLVTKLCPTLATPWTVTYQAPLSMGFSRQEHWGGLPFPSPV